MLNKIAIFLSIIVSAAALGVFIYTQFIFERPLPDNQVELEFLKDDADRSNVKESFQLKRMTINLKSKHKRLRFLDVTIHLVPFKSRHMDLMEKFKSLIQDTIIKISGEMHPTELNSVSGKIILETRIKKSINQKVGFPLVKNILFTHFVIQ